MTETQTVTLDAAVQHVDALRAALTRAKRARDPRTRAKAIGDAVQGIIPARVALSDARAVAVVETLDEAGTHDRGVVSDLADDLGISRPMVQQLEHRGRALNGTRGRPRSSAKRPART